MTWRRLAVAIDLPKAAFAIKEASLFAFAGPPGPVKLPHVRVVLAHGAAWWPGGIDWTASRDASESS